MKYYAKEHFYSNLDELLCELFVTNKPSYWKFLRHKVRNSGSATCIPTLKSSEDDKEPTVFSDVDKAEKLNEYFETISKVDNINDSNPTANN